VQPIKSVRRLSKKRKNGSETKNRAETRRQNAKRTGGEERKTIIGSEESVVRAKNEDADLTAHYERQKKESAARLRVRASDAARIESGRYTIYDFADNAFSFSPARKELAIKILIALRERPRAFAELENELAAPKSTLYLLLRALEESGLVTQCASRGAERGAAFE
jgi:hypothetical protein